MRVIGGKAKTAANNEKPNFLSQHLKKKAPG
uniref:Uncharacterized protein n=1 Tax=Anguilla anguilla TaxID=7936 RepID=A0A0E9VVH8_ANGAN